MIGQNWAWDHTRPRPSLQLSMESLAQELLEAIIDHVPPHHVRPCSLVARRWRKRSQQRYFGSVILSREHEAIRWYTNIPQDPDGIPSYARDVEIQSIRCWRDPTVLGRVLKCFSRVKTLVICETHLPSSEVQKIVASSEFGREVTSLIFISPRSTMPELMQLILSFPNLRELMINSISQTEPPASIPPDKTWQKEPLQSLELSSLHSKEMEFIALCGITSRRIDLSLGDAMIEKIIACSSETVSELLLQDGYPPIAPMTTLPPIVQLPPLSALTTMEVTIYPGFLSARLADFLPCIHSAPVLSSITFKYLKLTPPEDIPTSHLWNNVDKWLARLATHAKVKGGLTVVLALWPERNLKWEECLLEFRKAGGELKIETGTHS
ncbi:hypothetical protein BDM02DRAFT_3115208 [Thelephora ganbajun]|uniref:Uncharacterized protein n=1 Tax=Thelephora ganbajun TaxID=370292 RepID=A0ACB6ZG64_THEGA|nr:hypothetical protein BDM02DRAFT_3115208 [Thelephora ganbajun]